MPYFVYVTLKDMGTEGCSSPIAALEAAKSFASGLQKLGDAVIRIEDERGEIVVEGSKIGCENTTG